jgi:hypothetical protein
MGRMGRAKAGGAGEALLACQRLLQLQVLCYICIAWVRCMGALHGCIAWVHCMGALHGCIALHGCNKGAASTLAVSLLLADNSSIL